jgi:hypothetical protein
MATCEPRLTATAVESPLPGDRHGGFGERPGETGRWQHRNRAPGRLNSLAGGSGSMGALRSSGRLWTLIRVAIRDDTVAGWTGSPQAVVNT